MKLKITLMPEPGDDLTQALDVSGVKMQYPGTGHIIVDAAHVSLSSDEYETLGSENYRHEAGAAEAIKAEPIDTGTRLTADGLTALPAEPGQDSIAGVAPRSRSRSRR